MHQAILMYMQSYSADVLCNAYEIEWSSRWFEYAKLLWVPYSDQNSLHCSNVASS